MKRLPIHENTGSQNTSLEYFLNAAGGGISGDTRFFRLHDIKQGDLVELYEYDNVVSRAGFKIEQYNYKMSEYLAIGKYANRGIIGSLYDGDMYDKMAKAYQSLETHGYKKSDVIMVAGSAREKEKGDLSILFTKQYKDKISSAVKAGSSFMIAGRSGIDQISRKYIEACGYQESVITVQALREKKEPLPEDRYSEGDLERRMQVSLYPEKRKGDEMYYGQISLYHHPEYQVKLTANKGRTMVVRIKEGPYSLKNITSSEWAKLEGADVNRFEEKLRLGYLQIKFEGLKKIEKVAENYSINEITNHSGGAIGSDKAWEDIGREQGFNNHMHYYHGRKTNYGNVELSDSQIKEGIINAKNAASALGKSFSYKYSSLLGRNWFQVKYSEKILAVGRILLPGEKGSRGFVNKSGKMVVDGGTGYAVEMGIQHGKKVYVFNQEDSEKLKKSWYEWKNNSFIACPTPTLSKNFAGIGTRQINEHGLNAIKEVYSKTISHLNNKTKFYQNDIKKIDKNEVFVFGSNKNGFHGAGAAGFASFNISGNNWREYQYDKKPDGWKGCWNVKGIGEGYMEGTIGSSYAIPTVEKAGAKLSLSKNEIQKSIGKFYDFASNNQDKIFYVAYQDKRLLNGYTAEQMAEMFKCSGDIPENVYFHESMKKYFYNERGNEAVKKDIKNNKLSIDESEYKKALSGDYVQQNFYDGKFYLKGELDGKKIWGKYEASIPGASSLQMIRQGVRKETIRGPRQKRFKKGELVVMHDVGQNSPSYGERVLVRITSEPYRPNKRDFLKYEGWSENVWNDRKSQLLARGWEAYRYEYIGDIDKLGNLKLPDISQDKSVKKVRNNILEPNL